MDDTRNPHDDRILNWRELSDLMTAPGAHRHAAVDPPVAALNREYALVVENGSVKIVKEKEDPRLKRRVLERMTAADFRLLKKNQHVQVGTRQMPLGDYWLAHPARRTYEQVVFDPSTMTPKDGVLNLWKGFPHEPRPGNWNLFRQHLQTVGSNGDMEVFDFIMRWLALLVQFPEIPPGVALVWRGGQGTGKGFIARTIGALVGSQHFIHVSNIRHLLGHFNAHLQDALVVFADEAFWAGDKASIGALKTMVTEPTIMIERKGRDSVMATNHTHLLVSTNNRWAIPMEGDDRRFNVVDVPDTHQRDELYFRRIQEQLDNGGYAALLWDLKNIHIDPHQRLRAPSTITSLESALKQKIQSLNKEDEAWWYEKLESGFLLDKEPGLVWGEVDLSDLYLDYIEAMRHLNVPRPHTKSNLHLALKELLPEGFPRVSRPRVGLGRKRTWVFPPLAECRRAMAARIQHPNPFPQIDGEDD